MRNPAIAEFRVVDGRRLPRRYRALLRPGETLRDAQGREYTLPRYFFEVPSAEAATAKLAPHFRMDEFLQTDLHEASLFADYPRYVPCAVALLAAHLEVLRQHVGTYVHVAANGGYRTPAHAHGDAATPHQWGTAANLYRIGDAWLQRRKTIEHYRQIVRRILPGVRVRPYGTTPGTTYDHLHLDLGYLTVQPWG